MTGRSPTSIFAALLCASVLGCGSRRPPDNVLPEEQARAAALAGLTGARVMSEELEREGGRWIYSYDLEVAGREGVEEVHVDALTGEVVAREHESAEDEAGEAEAEEHGSGAAGEAGDNQIEDDAPAAVTTPYAPDLEPSDFVATVDNPWFPLTPGTVFRYAHTNGARNVVTVTDGAKSILGIRATVVRDQEYDGDELVEDTYDWYAQDRRGNVWYLGEDTRELEAGRLVSRSGSWEAGRNGAQPGIVMPATPETGRRYRQEYLEGEAEDIGEILEVDAGATVARGSFSGCVRTADTTPLEPDVRETKVYCRGVGLVLEEEGPGARNELVAVEGR